MQPRIFGSAGQRLVQKLRCTFEARDYAIRNHKMLTATSTSFEEMPSRNIFDWNNDQRMTAIRTSDFFHIPEVGKHHSAPLNLDYRN
jgi:hypothetical protein